MPELGAQQYPVDKPRSFSVPTPGERVPADKTGRALRMMGGTTSIADMIKGTERGIRVTRFWNIRPVDPRTILYTGLTRGGACLIEHGKISRPIKNFLFNESPMQGDVFWLDVATDDVYRCA